MQDGDLLGWSWISNTIDPVLQTRSTSESSMLRETLALNDNLVVFGSTLAKKILFNENKEATGVQIEGTGVGSGSITYTINATKEFILSAGAFRSPQMLIVSSIGPAATLQSNGIEVLADRPGAGQNMWDHVFFGPSYIVDTVTHNFLGDPAFSTAATEEYIKSRTGILTIVGGDLLGKFQTSIFWKRESFTSHTDWQAFEKLPAGAVSEATRADLDTTFGSDLPDIELLSLDAYTGSLNDFIFGAPDLKNFTSVCAVIVAPFSRGNITGYSISESRHEDFPFPSLDLSCCCYSLSCG
jgi:choline dehydrogenase-like flavoprotein